DLPIRVDQSLPNVPLRDVRSGAQAYTADIFSEGSKSVILENALVRVVISPHAGARAFVFEDKPTGRNIFTSIGAMRDDVATPPTPSPRDYIAKYTHQFPAGTFNRPYTFQILKTGQKAVARFTYEARDLLHGAVIIFTRTVTLEANSRSFEVVLTSAASLNCCMVPMRSISSLTVGQPSDFTNQFVTALGSIQDGAVALYDSKSHELATLSWMPAGFSQGTFEMKPTSALSILSFKAEQPAVLRFGYFSPPDVAAARTILDSLKGR
ncbi:MAG: hypothetical protein M3N19_10665, partial [Candidatus Eremiobacteraeota bacterium]|nr:hypothetical protein [Candidatus Eremiobacteraeota bacterium]